MIRHIVELCDRHEIAWYANEKRAAYAIQAASEIHTTPIRGVVSYAIALHEIGHILGQYQASRHVMVRETWA
jgi:CRISPR/Cas system-associated endonuclease Cas3-HD